MFKKLFPSNKTKTQFLVLPELNFEEENEFLDLVKTHNVSKETALKFDSFRELVFENNMLKKVYDYEDGTRHNRILLANEKGLPFNYFNENKFLGIKIAENGINQLGGTLSSEIKFESNIDVKFQYLGFISTQNSHLNFIKNTLHLIVPVYSDFSKMYVDYATPNVISILNSNTDIEAIELVYDELKYSEQNVVYDSVKFNFEEVDDLGEIGHSGIPLWVQYPEIPQCPKTGKTMDFILQLNAGPEIIAAPQDFPENHMEFGGGNGNLYVFFARESQIACYLFQGS